MSTKDFEMFWWKSSCLIASFFSVKSEMRRFTKNERENMMGKKERRLEIVLWQENQISSMY